MSPHPLPGLCQLAEADRMDVPGPNSRLDRDFPLILRNNRPAVLLLGLLSLVQLPELLDILVVRAEVLGQILVVDRQRERVPG